MPNNSIPRFLPGSNFQILLFMRKIVLFFLVTWFTGNLVFSQSDEKASRPKDLKSIFDIKYDGPRTQLKSASPFESGKMLTGPTWEYSLMHGGYFTIGTNHGVSENKIDDRCELTFGHPFSMTSFVYPVIDGQKFLPYDLVANDTPEVTTIGDTIYTKSTTENQLDLSTYLYSDPNDGLYLRYSIVNNDAVSHSVKMGLLFDAALGRWGDGYIEIDGMEVDSITTIEGVNTDSLIIWERKERPKGIGLEIDFEVNTPGEIVLGNWQNEYYSKAGEKQLYDLAIHSKWEQGELMPGDTLDFVLRFSLLFPDVGDQPFIRWDMPNALSIENQILFPANLVSNVEIFSGEESAGSYTLKVPETDNVIGWESKEGFDLNASQQVSYQNVMVSIPEIYDSLVVPIQIQLMSGGTVIDEISRPVFIPASPFSNEGLEVAIDTAYLQNQKVCFSFNSFKENTGQLLYDLHKNNVFVFDNGERVTDFSLGKDTTGGTNNTDIIFVLDVTGSMTNEIEAVRDNIIEFTDSLSYQGINFRLGMVTFLDVIEKIYDFTDDVQQFQTDVASQYAHGGGDRAENSLDALVMATQFDFRENSNRIVIWITDADFHINNTITQQTKESVTDQLLAAGIQVHCIGEPLFQTDFYDQITLNTGGSYFDINGNFRDILLEVSRLKQARNYLLSYFRTEPVDPADVFKIEVHYAGLGGSRTVSFGETRKTITAIDQTTLKVFPNPVSYLSQISLEGPKENCYEIRLYNLNGQVIAFRELREQSEIVTIDLNSLINPSELHSSQIYLLKIITRSPGGTLLGQETLKIGKF